MAVELSDDVVFTVYSWFQSEMHRAGRKIKMPKCKDLTKTYQFRWTKSFANKCYNELNLNDRIVCLLLKDIVIYAKSHNLLDRGTQLLSMGNITDICYKGLKGLADDEVSLITEIETCHRFLCNQSNDKNNLVRRLLESEGRKCTNLLYWYNLGYLTEVYMALSISCNQALAKLPQNEVSELPSNFELFRICTHVVSDEILPRLRAIMGSDLKVPPTILIK